MQEIIEQIKNMSEEDIIKFSKEFEIIFKPIKAKIDKQKADAKKAQEDEKLKKAFEAGDKVCEILGINGFPYTCKTKCWDSPYEPYIPDCLWEDVDSYYDEDNYPSKETWNAVSKYIEQFENNIPSSWFYTEKDAADCYPGHREYMFYIKGGTTKYVDERYFYENYFGTKK